MSNMTNNKRKIDSRSPQQGESPDSKIYKQSQGNSPIQYAKRQGLSQYMIGGVNDEAIEIKPLKNSVLVYAPSETIRRKLLGLTKLGNFQIKVSKFYTDHKQKITIQAAATKEINENKVTKNRVYKVIPKPVDTEILNIKKQGNMLRQTGADIKIVKQLGKAGYLLVTLSERDFILYVLSLIV